MLTLSREEVIAFTGYKRAQDQTRELERVGVPYKIMRGRVVVLTAHVTAYMENRPIRQEVGIAPVEFPKLNAGLRRWQQERNEFHAEDAAAAAEYQRTHAVEIAAIESQNEKDRLARAAAYRSAMGAKRRAAELLRTPAWADMDAIRAVYEEAQRTTRSTGTPHHVDHEIPLQGRKVSGLHVANNLRVLPASDNCRKHNRYEPC